MQPIFQAVAAVLVAGWSARAGLGGGVVDVAPDLAATTLDVHAAGRLRQRGARGRGRSHRQGLRAVPGPGAGDRPGASAGLAGLDARSPAARRPRGRGRDPPPDRGTDRRPAGCGRLSPGHARRGDRGRITAARLERPARRGLHAAAGRQRDGRQCAVLDPLPHRHPSRMGGTPAGGSVGAAAGPGGGGRGPRLAGGHPGRAAGGDAPLPARRRADPPAEFDRPHPPMDGPSRGHRALHPLASPPPRGD